MLLVDSDGYAVIIGIGDASLIGFRQDSYKLQHLFRHHAVVSWILHFTKMKISIFIHQTFYFYLFLLRLNFEFVKENENEWDRIEKHGGIIGEFDFRNARTETSFRTSRSLGDFDLKQFNGKVQHNGETMVTATPDIRVFPSQIKKYFTCTVIIYHHITYPIYNSDSPALYLHRKDSRAVYLMKIYSQRWTITTMDIVAMAKVWFQNICWMRCCRVTTAIEI